MHNHTPTHLLSHTHTSTHTYISIRLCAYLQRWMNRLWLGPLFPLLARLVGMPVLHANANQKGADNLPRTPLNHARMVDRLLEVFDSFPLPHSPHTLAFHTQLSNMHTNTNTNMYACMHVCIHVCTHTHVHAFTHMLTLTLSHAQPNRHACARTPIYK